MIYFIRNTASGDIKIGFAADPWNRLAGLQTGSVARLELRALIEGDREIEKALHAQYAALRVRGEWFAFAPPLSDFIKAQAAPGRPPLKRDLRSGRLATWMRENGETDVTLAPKVGLHHSQVNRIRRGASRASAASARRFEAVTSIPAGTFVMGAVA